LLRYWINRGKPYRKRGYEPGQWGMVPVQARVACLQIGDAGGQMKGLIPGGRGISDTERGRDDKDSDQNGG